VLFDRFSLENYNSVIFAKSGSGKSYATKLEILRTLMFDTEVIVIDPEREYEFLSQAVGGRYFNISLNSEHHINPFDLAPPREDESPADVFALKHCGAGGHVPHHARWPLARGGRDHGQSYYGDLRA
jgi:hypothetical protein